MATLVFFVRSLGVDVFSVLHFDIVPIDLKPQDRFDFLGLLWAELQGRTILAGLDRLDVYFVGEGWGVLYADVLSVVSDFAWHFVVGLEC